MSQPRPGDINDVILDLMTYQAFIAGLSHLPDMIAAGGMTLQECLLRILVEACDSQLAFAADAHRQQIQLALAADDTRGAQQSMPGILA